MSLRDTLVRSFVASACTAAATDPAGEVRVDVEPGATVTEVMRWRLGVASGPAGPLSGGTWRVVRKLGYNDRAARRGSAATLVVQP